MSVCKEVAVGKIFNKLGEKLAKWISFKDDEGAYIEMNGEEVT